MIDLHSHILPGIDDGAKDLEMSLEMARIAVRDGTRILACTPHIHPPTYVNDGDSIAKAVHALRAQLEKEEISLHLVVGADIQITPDLIDGLNSGRYPTLGGTRYFLFEPPHHVMPPNIVGFCEKIIEANYVPILTHPERLTWAARNYDTICKLEEIGAAIQLTAGSVTGVFGKEAKTFCERMLREGRVDLIASDAHNLKHRPPILSKARQTISELLGEEMGSKLTVGNPGMIIRDERLPEKKRKKLDAQLKNDNIFATLWSNLVNKG